jgi:hypothetical protein
VVELSEEPREVDRAVLPRARLHPRHQAPFASSSRTSAWQA